MLDTRRRSRSISTSLMKAILLLLTGVLTLAFAGCESDVPRDPSQPAITFGNDKFRDEGYERRAGTATDREKTDW